MTRPQLGPWLRDERGPHDGLMAAAVDRLGRDVVDSLNTGYRMRDEGKLLVTYGHGGPWDLDDQVDENRFTMEAWGAQMELRAIQRRNRSTHGEDEGGGASEEKALLRIPGRTDRNCRPGRQGRRPGPGVPDRGRLTGPEAASATVAAARAIMAVERTWAGATRRLLDGLGSLSA